MFWVVLNNISYWAELYGSVSVSLLTFMVTGKYSSNQMNNIIVSLKLTILLIVILAKHRFYRPFTVNTDLLQTQKCKKVCITDLGL